MTWLPALLEIDLPCFDERLYLLIAGVLIIMVSLATRLDFFRKVTLRTGSGHLRLVLGLAIGCVFVCGWAFLYASSRDKVTPIGKITRFEVREHGVYDIYDGSTLLHLACTDILYHADSRDPIRPGHSAAFTLSSDKELNPAANARVVVGASALLMTGGHIYSLHVDDLHNVLAAADAAEITLRRIK